MEKKKSKKIVSDVILSEEEKRIKELMATGMSFYNAREQAREEKYGGKPPEGFRSWGDYWKAY